MSTETYGTHVQENNRHVEHGEEWASDEAAAEQEAMMADTDTHGAEGDGAAIEGTGAAVEDDGAAIEDNGAAIEDDGAAVDGNGTACADDGQVIDGPLIATEVMDDFLSRWNGIQVSFVDDPGTSVENADALTQEVGAALLKSFTDRSSRLSSGWREAADTEQLRLALKRYRAFLGVLLPR